MKTVVRILATAVFALACLYGCQTTQPTDEMNRQVLNNEDPMSLQSMRDNDQVVTGGIGEDIAFSGEDVLFPGKNAGAENPQTGVKNNTIYFRFDRSTVDTQFKQIVDANARYLRAHPNARLRLEGHTDPRGSREYNIGLGQRRADQVANQLLAQGVKKNELVIVSYGKEKLARMGSTEDDYALDRRVELVYEAQ